MDRRTRVKGGPKGKVFAMVQVREDGAWTGVKLRELEAADNSGCVLNRNSRGLGNQSDQEDGRETKIKENSLG